MMAYFSQQCAVHTLELFSNQIHAFSRKGHLSLRDDVQMASRGEAETRTETETSAKMIVVTPRGMAIGHMVTLAIGHMVMFVNVVEEAFRPKITDPVHSFMTCLEALQDLEPHEFHVNATKARLTKMLSVIEQLHKLHNEGVEVEGRISELTYENDEIEEEIVKLNEKIRNLQDELACAAAKKENKDSEITALRESLATFSASIQSVQLDLKGVT
ncbi:hypothetical protein CDL15_Pgr022086 [Punica granatum]|uniref:Uncharacterized protein n=1 Tax=Punica granatum TaxID=22663 RepID=A0A218VTK2_PUNGR|nr:hypothetical protein CDL15_Pgr022086 [Punica granatum]